MPGRSNTWDKGFDMLSQWVEKVGGVRSVWKRLRMVRTYGPYNTEVKIDPQGCGRSKPLSSRGAFNSQVRSVRSTDRSASGPNCRRNFNIGFGSHGSRRSCSSQSKSDQRVTETAPEVRRALSSASSMVAPRASATPMRRLPATAGLPKRRSWVS